jgi:hypothetical protein
MRFGMRILVVGLFCAAFALGCKNNTPPTYPVSTGGPGAPPAPMATGKKGVPQPPPPPP